MERGARLFSKIRSLIQRRPGISLGLECFVMLAPWWRRDYVQNTMRPITKEPWFSWGYVIEWGALPGATPLGWFICIRLPSWQYMPAPLSFDRSPCWHQAVLYYSEPLRRDHGRIVEEGWRCLDVALYE